MLDILNDQLIRKGEEPVAFDHDCREGICGSCAMMNNGMAHGPERATTTCQLHMRSFAYGAEIYIEPWRAGPFRSSKTSCATAARSTGSSRAAGSVSVNTGGAPDGE